MTITVLRETATVTPKSGGKAKIGIITPGTGSSGVYPKETIEAAGRDRVFPQGTQMFFNHATESEDWTRPEGDLHNLVGVLTEDAHWDDESGGLVAEAKIYSHWKPIISDMAEDIGVSIRASGEVSEANGQRIVTKLTEARSVDFVTKAGRGGRVIEVLESARMREGIIDETRALLRKAVGDAHPNSWLMIRDHTDTTVWYDVEAGRTDVTYEQTYTRDGINVTLTGTPTEVFPTTVYVPNQTNPAPAGNGNQNSDNKEASEMGDTRNTDTSRVDEADSKKPNPFAKGGDSGSGGGNSNETEVEKLRRENGELKAEIKRLKAGKAKEARRYEVAGIVEEAFENIDAPTAKSDLIEKLTESESEKDTLIAEAKKRADEIHNLGGGNGHVRGLGESRPANTTEADDTPITFADLEALKGA